MKLLYIVTLDGREIYRTLHDVDAHKFKCRHCRKHKEAFSNYETKIKPL